MVVQSSNHQEHFRVLVFSKTAGYRHESIPAGFTAIKSLANKGAVPFSVDASEDATLFDTPSLSQYAVIILLQCSGDFLSATQLDALKAFVRAGGGVVGIHCASTGMPHDEWYGAMIGAVFTDHPVPQHAVMSITDPTHPIVASKLDQVKPGLQSSSGEMHWGWFGEWYNFSSNPRSSELSHVLLTVDESTYEGGKLGMDHPIAWCREFEGGRVFYTALGHFDQEYSDEVFMAQILNGILWVARKLL